MNDNDTRKRRKTAAKSKALKQPLVNELPTVINEQGFEYKLVQADLDAITDMVANGASANYVAVQMGLSEGELNNAVNNSERVKNAVKKGLALDEQEIAQSLRETAKKGNIAALIWYQKNKHGWKDSSEQKTGGDITINVSTGINRASTKPAIDAEFSESD